MKSIISIIRPKKPTEVENRIAMLDRTFTFLGEPCYRNLENGEVYHMVAGGVAPPSRLNAGYACVLGVVKEEGKDLPAFKVLDEVQRKSVHDLMGDCVLLQEKFGYAVSENLFQPWNGDFDAYSALVAEFNNDLREAKGKRWGFYPSPPMVADESARIQLYLSLIPQLVDKDNKRLFLGNATILMNALMNALPEASLKWTIHTCPPPLLALGHVVYWTVQSKPWTRTVNRIADLSVMSEAERREFEIYGGFERLYNSQPQRRYYHDVD